MKAITREARDELIELLDRSLSSRAVITSIKALPLIDSPPDLAAKWQPRTSGDHEFEIFAERDGFLFGCVKSPESGAWLPSKWHKDGEHVLQDIYDLIPLHPHSALLNELKTTARLSDPQTSDAYLISEGLHRRLVAALEQWK